MSLGRFFTLFAVLVGSVACSSNDAPPPPPANGQAVPPASTETAASDPKIRFVDAAGKDVESIYLTDAVTVRVDGLAAGKSVEITATMKPWSARATFVAHESGTIDTS